MTKAVLSHFSDGGFIVDMTSVTAYAGHPALLDYAIRSERGIVRSDMIHITICMDSGVSKM